MPTLLDRLYGDFDTAGSQTRMTVNQANPADPANPADGADTAEAVHFNAVLQPSSLHYSISKARAARG
jgi:hypothetical protein